MNDKKTLLELARGLDPNDTFESIARDYLRSEVMLLDSHNARVRKDRPLRDERTPGQRVAEAIDGRSNPRVILKAVLEELDSLKEELDDDPDVFGHAQSVAEITRVAREAAGIPEEEE